MSFAVLGALAGAGPGVQSGLDAKSRRQTEADNRDINMSREKRERDLHQWGQDFAESMRLRGMIEDPVAWNEYFSNPMIANTGAIPTGQMSPVMPQAPQVPQPTALPGAADGGEMMVGPPEAQPMMGPPEAPPPAPPQTTRRERYNQWYNMAASRAALTGGLEGFQKFQEMEDAMSRRQVLGYALQAVRAMDENNVGEAMRAGNAALEVTPFDTGLKFVAQNGKLHMQGADGSVGEPLDANSLRAFTEDHMKTPENYLAWKAQYETERAAQAGEKIRDKNADTAALQAKVYSDESPSRIYAREAGAYRDIASGRAALTPNSSGEEGLGWNENNILKMEADISDAVQKGQLGFSGPWATEAFADTPVGSMAIGFVKDLRRNNPPDSMNNNLASAVVRTALMNFVDGAPGEALLRGARVGQDEVSGAYVLGLPGQDPIVVPEQIALGLRRNLALNEQMLEE